MFNKNIQMPDSAQKRDANAHNSNTVELGYNELGYNKLPLIANGKSL